MLLLNHKREQPNGCHLTMNDLLIKSSRSGSVNHERLFFIMCITTIIKIISISTSYMGITIIITPFLLKRKLVGVRQTTASRSPSRLSIFYINSFLSSSVYAYYLQHVCLRQKPPPASLTLAFSACFLSENTALSHQKSSIFNDIGQPDFFRVPGIPTSFGCLLRFYTVYTVSVYRQRGFKLLYRSRYVSF